ncbi:zinc finger protein 628-like [Folsomia candida]|uniref:zinc finger protein 628-like n=1 Tax=Folsomia candida TaxID=158441 RepID=UPI0016051F7C|nr:zinc finger protein 628-like [Folsomia candida]
MDFSLASYFHTRELIPEHGFTCENCFTTIEMDSNPEKKWKCLHCSLAFKRERDFNRHLVTHDPNAKVKCKDCGQILKNPVTLYRHVSHMHTNRVRPACNICNDTFFNHFHLRKHIDNVHIKKERPRFPCRFPGCEKTYLNKRSLSAHTKTDHVENAVRFPCTLCVRGMYLRIVVRKDRVTTTFVQSKNKSVNLLRRGFCFYT